MITESRDYLIWSHYHRAWWRDNSAGYTPYVLEAGRYTCAEAMARYQLGRDEPKHITQVEATFKGENMDQYPDLSRPGEEPKPAKRFVGRLEFVTGVWA
jgi:hypothetical protein